jgi:hypothetical protein
MMVCACQRTVVPVTTYKSRANILPPLAVAHHTLISAATTANVDGLTGAVASNDAVVGDSFASKYYVVVVYLTSLLLITYILISVATASTAAALGVTADSNLLVPVVAEGKQ